MNHRKKIIILGSVIALITFAYFLPRQPAVNWQLYANNDLGVSLRYPGKVAGDKVVFYQAGKTIVVTTESSDLYTRRKELQLLSDDKEIFRKFNEIKKQDHHTFPNAAWAIEVRDIRSDADLEKFIQDKFGDTSYDYKRGCTLGPKLKSSKEGIYKVIIVPTKMGPAPDPYGPDSSCFINWMMVFRYSPEYQRAVMWEIGQEYMFMPFFQAPCSKQKGCENLTVDNIMAESFQFIPKSLN